MSGNDSFHVLDASDVTTRLLNLDSFELECFVITELSSTAFIAISHVWTENFFPAIPTPDCDGIRRLFRVLQNPKYQNLASIKYLWLDNWCIDQTDEMDKFNQIPHMMSIYEAAVATVVPIRDHVENAQQDMQAMIETVRDECQSSGVNFDWYSGSEAAGTMKFSEKTQRILRGYLPFITMISTLRWSTRIWTAQEFVKSKRCILVDPSSAVLELDHEKIGCLDILEYWYYHSSIAADGTCAGVLSFQALLASKNLATTSNTTGSSLSAMGQSLYRQSQRPEDAVYGLMGASGVTIAPIRHETAEAAWKRWWRAALRKNALKIACVIPCAEGRRPQIETREIEPCSSLYLPFDIGRRSLAAYSCEEPRWLVPEIGISKDGTLHVTGRIAGHVEPLIHIVIPAEGQPEPLAAFKRALSDMIQVRPDLMVALCRGLFMRTCQVHPQVAKLLQILPSIAGSATQTNPSTTERWADLFLANLLPLIKSLRPGVQFFVVKLLRDETETITLMSTNNDHPVGDLIALDFNIKDKKDPSQKAMLVVRVSRESGVLHKFGRLSRVQTATTTAGNDTTFMDKEMLNEKNLHLENPQCSEIVIGGLNCDSCRFPEKYEQMPRTWAELRFPASTAAVESTTPT